MRLFTQAIAAALVAAAAAAPALAQAPAPVVERTRGALVLQNVPETPAEVRDRLLQYANTRGAGFGGFLPDGGIVITTRFGETAQIHEVRAPLGMRRQLTFYPEPVAGVQVRPGAAGDLFFGKDVGGDEFVRPWRFDRASGRAAVLFDEPRTQNASLVFTRDGAKAAWSITRSGTARRQIVTVAMSDPAARTVVHEADGAWAPVDWSPDGRKLLLANYVSVADSRRYVLDLDTRQLTQITPDLTVSYDGGAFAADGRSVFLLSDEGSPFQRLVRVDLASQARTVLTPDLAWDVEGMELSPDGRVLATVVNQDGLSVLNLMDARTGRALPGPRLPAGLIGGLEFDAQSRRLGFSFSASDSPSDVWVYDLRTRALTRWTQSEVGGLDPAGFVAPDLIRYPTFDAVNGAPRQIPAFVYRPRGRTGPTPVVIDIHGGPEAQSRPAFNSRIQYWVNELGVTVIVPNVRGSTGYGKEFVALDNGFKRLDAVKDIGALLDWIGAQPTLDSKRVAVYGGSYGGYMVLASMVAFNDRLAGGVNIVGISNFVTFLRNTEGYRRDLRRVEYGDERDPAMRAFMEEIAPLNNASKITRPLFVIQGANDPRVPRSEAEQIVARVRANGGDVWYMLAMDEGHGFRKKSNMDAQREAETLFFRKVFGLN